MFIQIISSDSCRGWEGNDAEIVETECSTLKEFMEELMRDEFDMDEEEIAKELTGELWKEQGFGFFPEGEVDGEVLEYGYEDEETTTTYRVYEPPVYILLFDSSQGRLFKMDKTYQQFVQQIVRKYYSQEIVEFTSKGIIVNMNIREWFDGWCHDNELTIFESTNIETVEFDHFFND